MQSLSINKLTTLSGHTGAIYALSPNQDNNIFFSSGADGYVTSWDSLNPKNGDLLAKVPNTVYAMGSTENGDLIIGHNYDGIHLMAINGKKEKGTIKLTTKQIFDIRLINNFALIGTGEGELILLDIQHLKIIKRRTYSNKSLRTIAVHSTNKEIALGFSDNYIRIVDPETFDIIHEFEGHTNSVFKLSYAPDNDFLLSGSRDAYIRVWDVSNNYHKHFECVAHMWAINDIAFSPDGKHFVTCSMDKTIKIWDAQNFDLMKVIDSKRYEGHTSSVNKILWLQNGLVVSASDDRTIIIWEIELEN